MGNLEINVLGHYFLIWFHNHYNALMSLRITGHPWNVCMHVRERERERSASIFWSEELLSGRGGGGAAIERDRRERTLPPPFMEVLEFPVPGASHLHASHVHTGNWGRGESKEDDRREERSFLHRHHHHPRCRHPRRGDAADLLHTTIRFTHSRFKPACADRVRRGK